MSEATYWSRIESRVGRRSLLKGSLAVGGGLAAATLIGCGDDDAPGTATGDTPGDSGPSTQPTTDAGASGGNGGGGSVRFRLDGDLPTMSTLVAAAITVGVGSHAYDKLIDLQVGPGVDPFAADITSQFATAMPEQPDELTYVFTIRQGARFHDVDPVNGREVTAEDVKYSIDLIRSEGAFVGDYEAIESTETPDDQTVVVRTSQPWSPLLPFMAGHYGVRIVPHEIVDDGSFETRAVGSGPYIFEQWDAASSVRFRKNPDYWDESVGHLDGLEFPIIPEASSAAAAFRTEQVDILVGDARRVSCVEMEDLRAQMPDAQTQDLPSTSGWFAYNTSMAPFDDVRVRRAVALLYDREAEAAAIFCGESTTTGIIPITTALQPYDYPESADYLQRDVAEARRLLEAAGYPDGFQTTGAWTPQYGETYAASLERVVGDLREGGIELQPVQYDYTVWIADIYRGAYDFDGIMWGSGRYYPDVDPFIAYWLHPEGIANQSRVNDPEITELIELQRTQLDPEERWATVHEVQRLEAENMYYTWRHNGMGTVFTQPRVQDYQHHAAYDNRPLWKTRVDA